MENVEGWHAEGVTEGVVPRTRLIATSMASLFEGRFPSSPPVADSDDEKRRRLARRRRDGRSRLASRGVLLQSRFARQLPQRGSPFGRFMTPCFSIRKSNFYLQSRPPSSRDVFHRRRLWRIQTMENAEGWHAEGVTEGVVPRLTGASAAARPPSSPRPA